MAERKALTTEQRKRLSWMRAMLTEAERNGEHPSWKLFDAAWSLAYGAPNKKSRVKMCLEAIRSRAETRELEGYDPFVSLLPVLCSIDRAFEHLTQTQVSKVLASADLSSRAKRGGNGQRGPVNALARLALTCGALGCPRIEKPTQEDVDRETNRFKSARANR